MQNRVVQFLLLMLLMLLMLPVEAQNLSGQRYKIAACDWMMLKRQKIGAFQLMKELGGDGIEMDIGGLGTRDTFDNKFHQPYFQILFPETARKYNVEIASVAMSGFYGQSFLTHNNYKVLINDCIATMKCVGVKVAFLPLGGIKEDWTKPGQARTELIERLRCAGDMAAKENMVIGIRTHLDAKSELKLLKEIDSEGIKIYYSLQNALDNKRDVCKEIKLLGKKRICQIHFSDTDGVTLPYNKRFDINKIKKTLDKIGWSGWLVVERSRDVNDIRSVKKNFGTNIQYLKNIFQK